VNHRDQLAGRQRSSFSRRNGICRGESALLFLSPHRQSSAELNAASKHLRESRVHEKFVRVEFLADENFNDALISDAFAGA
jgi:hypothetical protein